MKNPLHIIIRICIVLGVFIFIYSLASSTHHVNTNKIVQLIPEGEFEYGPGCSYWIKTEGKQLYRPIYQSKLGFQNPKMNIKGETVKITPVTVEQLPLNASVGSTFRQIYYYKDIKLLFNNIITFVCPPGCEGSCEVTEFDSTLTVTEKLKTETYRLEGDCDC